MNEYTKKWTIGSHKNNNSNKDSEIKKKKETLTVVCVLCFYRMTQPIYSEYSFWYEMCFSVPNFDIILIGVTYESHMHRPTKSIQCW